MEFYASCPEGFEDALSDELRALGTPQIRKLKGRVSFGGTVTDAERVCLWSRLASRVFVVLARFACADADDLYAGVRAMPWERILQPGGTIAVTARGTNRELRNSRYAALCVKDGVCDRLLDKTGRRPDVDTDYPDARLALSLRGDKASIHLDLSGEPLFKRLPREATRAGTNVAAHVLRPDYAALLLAEAGWARLCSDEGAEPVLIDPCCAGGGVVLEAERILTQTAPGLTRSSWGFEAWQEHDEAVWTMLIREADEKAERGAARKGRIIAADANPEAISVLKRVLKGANAGQKTTISPAQTRKIADRLGIHPGSKPLCGIIATDLTEAPLEATGRALNTLGNLRSMAALAQADTVVLTRSDLIERALNATAEHGITVRPNNEEARLLRFAAPATQSETHEPDGTSQAAATAASVDVGSGKPVAVLVPESDQFAARLRKVARLRRKWARREGVTCYRVYDADLPDYAAAIDLYEGTGDNPERWLVIAEYAAPKSVDPSLAQARMLDMLAIAPRVLDVDPAHVFSRSRTRSRGGSQYAKRAEEAGRKDPLAKAHTVQEGGLSFLVNFDGYLDTGIFLDHRITRDLVRRYARDTRFLNLFAYTGTATCYAADGGAVATTTVDMSNTYLDWAERNMRANGFTGRAHRFVRADVLAWVSEQRRGTRTWDLIFCDPPTFSNSSKMGDRTWDVQRDHVDLLCSLADLLAPGGIVIFSCNLRTFKPDVAALNAAGIEIEDISARTIPEDFARNPRIHRCYVVRRL